ncbi:hypothetical protein ES707_06367 [subsurface metagenome]
MDFNSFNKWRKERNEERQEKLQEKLYSASQSQLVWRKFKKHKLASLGLSVLAIFYFCVLFAGFVAPYGKLERFKEFNYVPPTRVHFFSEQDGLRRPFIYKIKRELDRKTFQYHCIEDKSREYTVRFFVKTQPFKLLFFIPCSTKLFGVEETPIFLFGTDRLGRDLFSRIVFGGSISLSIGFAGVILSFVLGGLFGSISGYLGGIIDNVIQRMIELLMSVPQIPLWIALSAAVPRDWSVIKTYFAITLILALVGWTGLARVVRGKILSLREEDFALAAKVTGASDARILLRHLLPGFTSYMVVHLTLAVPAMILGETTLSFLGLGIQPPAVSWGTLLQDAQNLSVLAIHSWILIPCIFVIITVLMFNFVGDGLRDAADPYSTR